MVEEVHASLDEQDAPDGVVDPRLRYLALGHELFEQGDVFDVVVFLARSVGNHDHVNAGVD